MTAPPKIISRLSPKQAEAWHLLEKSTEVKKLLFGGAAGPGKTWFGCFWKTYRRIRYPNTRGLIGRNQYSDLRDSTLNTFLEFWNTYGQHNPQGVTGKYNEGTHIFKFSNGSEEYFRHLAYEPSDRDYNRLGSVEYTDAFIDELVEIPEKAFDVVSSRIRYKIGDTDAGVPKLLGCSNPADNWVKARFVMDKHGNPVQPRKGEAFISATLQDNPNEEFRRVYDDNLSDMSNYDQARLRFGDWSVIDEAGEKFYWAFERRRHVQKIAFNPDLPVHLSFDQNVVPYITLTCWQIVQIGFHRKLQCFDEFCLPHPKSNTEAVCKAFLDKYGGYVKTVYIYGDASGNKRDTRAGQNDYQIARRSLQKVWNDASDRTERSNPPVINRKDFINKILQGQIPVVEVAIGDNCTETVRDFSMLNQDANGGKLKVKITDPKTKVTFENIGHTSDTADYIITKVFQKEFQAFRAKKGFGIHYG
jgi:phage terminase large subunit